MFGRGIPRSADRAPKLWLWLWLWLPLQLSLLPLAGEGARRADGGLLASGFWLLASGFWLLASGFWLGKSLSTLLFLRASRLTPLPQKPATAAQSLSLLQAKKNPAASGSGVLGLNPDDDLLSHSLGCTTIGAATFHFRVRDGIGWFHSANFIREAV